uniref:sensor histidine kinase n=1 Tax=Paenibacillus forsythiae TaxID=365616 RepID=UPI00047093D9
GQPRLKPETMPATALLERLLAKWNDPLVLDGRTLRYDFPQNMDTPVTADVYYLGRAVDNVLDNAVKYSYPGSSITLEARMTPRSLLLHVSDCGMGIPPEALKHVFDSFYRVDPARNSGVPGSGLGLAIAREVLHLHGGEIHASLNGNPGCTFTIEIPLGEAERDAMRISKDPVRRNA